MKKFLRAFTLIEMLVVIAIISIVAAMVAGMASAAKNKQHAAQVEGNKQKLILLIANYQSKLNFYPPDNANLAEYSLPNYNPRNYDAWAATNPLLYELSGATNLTNGNIFVFNGVQISGSDYATAYGRNGVANSNPDEPHYFYTPRSINEYSYYIFNGGTNECAGFTVPVSLTNVPFTNYWHYDASSTNRHNLSSYDLWAEYSIGTKGGSNIVVTNGNW